MPDTTYEITVLVQANSPIEAQLAVAKAIGDQIESGAASNAGVKYASVSLGVLS